MSIGYYAVALNLSEISLLLEEFVDNISILCTYSLKFCLGFYFYTSFVSRKPGVLKIKKSKEEKVSCSES